MAIVTGGGKGIGRAIALGLAQAGARVVGASRTQAELEAVAEEISLGGGEALAVVTDLTVNEQRERESPSQQHFTLCGIRSPLTCLKTGWTYATFRNCSGTGTSAPPSAIPTSARKQWGGFVVLLTRSACPRTNSTEVRKSETKVTGIRQILYALRTKKFVVCKFGAIPFTVGSLVLASVGKPAVQEVQDETLGMCNHASVDCDGLVRSYAHVSAAGSNRDCNGSSSNCDYDRNTNADRYANVDGYSFTNYYTISNRYADSDTNDYSFAYEYAYCNNHTDSDAYIYSHSHAHSNANTNTKVCVDIRLRQWIC